MRVKRLVRPHGRRPKGPRQQRRKPPATVRPRPALLASPVELGAGVAADGGGPCLPPGPPSLAQAGAAAAAGTAGLRGPGWGAAQAPARFVPLTTASCVSLQEQPQHRESWSLGRGPGSPQCHPSPRGAHSSSSHPCPQAPESPSVPPSPQELPGRRGPVPGRRFCAARTPALPAEKAQLLSPAAPTIPSPAAPRAALPPYTTPPRMRRQRSAPDLKESGAAV